VALNAPIAKKLCAAILVLALACVLSAAGIVRAANPPTTNLPAQTLGDSAQTHLRSLIESGYLPELRWPNFQTYRDDVARFYQSYGYELPWISAMQPTRQARETITILQNAGEKGLSADDYDGPRWGERIEKLEPLNRHASEDDSMKFDLALTISMMRYISDLHTGRVDPRIFGIQANISRRKYDLAKFLADNVVRSPDVAASLAPVEPTYPGYHRTLEALNKYRQLASEPDSGQPLPTVKKAVAPGGTYAGVPQLARFLHLVGDLPESEQISPDTTVYEGPLVEAVKRFQERHGLDPDGRIGAHTIRELNVPLAQRVRQIQLTLERWRWLPSEYGQQPIVVNIPEFRLRAYDKDFRAAVTMKVVVGKAYDHNTPVFMSELTSVIFRPYWDVPYSIVRAEIVPALKRDPSYLQNEDMELLDARRHVLANQAVTDAILVELRAGTVFIRQRPGPNNSLGLIKFEFPNQYNVYMHDTPARLLFSKSKRDFSHGCIRLQDPVALAGWVLRDNPGWDEQRILAAMDGSDDHEVKLAHPIPVLIVYGTVIVLEDEVIRFYDDLYGQDAELEHALRTQSEYTTSTSGAN
jgi:murein L,D-transpeptidase YcbB/YkuD